MIDQLKEKLPLIRQWINDLLYTSSAQSKSIKEFGFKRLSQYYSEETLNLARVVVADRLPVPPLAALGFTNPQFASFEQGNYGAITYKNTYFIKPEEVHCEATHFHELIHVAQWAYLGEEKFILAYAIGLLQAGYRNSPLEVMAYNHAENFQKNGAPYDVEKSARTELDTIHSFYPGQSPERLSQK